VDEPYDRDTLSFVGRMDYYPNQECMIRFCAEVLPRLRARRPSIRLLIVGADPSREIRRLAEQPGVTVTGSVPDVRPYVRRSALMIAPLNIARGTQNKILESMAMGVPVVTSEVAAGGVDALADEHLLVARDAAGYEAAVLRLLDRPDERARLAAAGRARVQSHHDWSASMRRLDGIIDRFIGAGRATPAARSESRSGIRVGAT
jgi:glycosyltransferase involved in cell wall biosynthesis